MLCEQKDHAKIIEKGKPDDVIIGIKNAHVSCDSLVLTYPGLFLSFFGNRYLPGVFGKC